MDIRIPGGVLRAPLPVRVVYACSIGLFLAYVAHAATNVGGDGLDPLFQKWVNDAIPIGCAFVCLERARRVRAERAAWTLMSAGLLFWTAGNAYYSLYVINISPLPIPSTADFIWLCEYPLLFMALALLLRSRHSDYSMSMWLDGAIAGLAVSAGCAAVVLDAALKGSSAAPTAALLTNIAYPVGDMILLGMVAVALSVRHWRLERTWATLGVAVLAFAVTDGIFVVQSANGTYQVGTLVDAGWPLCGLLFAYAAWQPVSRQASVAADGGRRFVVPVLFGLFGLVLLVIDNHVKQINTFAQGLAAGSVLVVIVRMSVTFRDNWRLLGRSRDEAHALAAKNNQLLELDRVKEQLRQSQKMEAVGQLAGGIAHDFNNLLTAIIGYAELLAPRVNGDEGAAGDLDTITKAAERAADLTRQLLTFSNNRVTTATVVDVNEIVDETKRLLEPLIGEHIRLEIAVDPRLGRTHAEASAISQILVNLALNARDAMPAGGTLKVSTRNTDLTEESAREVEGGHAGSWIVLAVADDGCGMDAETKQRAFEPFFTTKAIGQGTGLGLATVYATAHAAGGFVTACSEVGRGSSFEVFLPRTVSDAAARPSGHLPRPVLRGTETVLVVEDEAMVRELVTAVLTEAGYHVSAAAGPREALELFTNAPDAFALLLSDVVMPVMNGPELAARLRILRPRLRVLYMSGYSDGVLGQGSTTDAGVIALQKPFQAATLLARVREALDGSTHAAAA